MTFIDNNHKNFEFLVIHQPVLTMIGQSLQMILEGSFRAALAPRILGKQPVATKMFRIDSLKERWSRDVQSLCEPINVGHVSPFFGPLGPNHLKVGDV